MPQPPAAELMALAPGIGPELDNKHLTLSDLALQLRNGNPDAWDTFLMRLQSYYEDLTMKVVQAPAEEVMVAQGRAQATFALLRIFKECTVERKHERPLPGNPQAP